MTQDSFSTSSGVSPDYIIAVEKRMLHLENQIQQLEKLIAQQETIINSLNMKIPNTSLISPKFISRAFAAWGHVIAAQLMITIPLYFLIFFLGAILGSF